MNGRIHSAVLLSLFVVVNAHEIFAQTVSRSSSKKYSYLHLKATDGLGRTFVDNGGDINFKKTVGLFYSLWLGQHRSGQKDVYDIQKLLDSKPEALNDVKGTSESPLNEFHFWGEPLYGYYSMSDPWVVTRHVELFCNAGIDYLCIDATNRIIYHEPVRNLLRVLQSFYDQGFNIPKIVFYTNSLSGTTVQDLYNSYYKSEQYNHLWYSPSGKPIIIGITKNNRNASDMTKFHNYDDFVSEEMQAYFDVRESQWPNGDFNPEAIPWMSWQYPQWNHNGTVAVPVAQHSHSAIDASSMHPECSRAFNNITKEVESDWTAGASFQTMWDAVHADSEKIDNVLVASFNEWMAIKYANQHGRDRVFFVDVFNHEFSRDIEMMRGGYNDNFYLQLVRNVRKFKIINSESEGENTNRINIRNFSETQWEKVKSVYADFAGDAINRDFEGAAGKVWYKDSSARNDIVEIRVTHDKRSVYFRIKTVDPITIHDGKSVNWMNILIGDGTTAGTFFGYKYIVNRQPTVGGKTLIEQSQGGYNWKDSGNADYAIDGNIMQVSIPLSAIGLDSRSCRFEFKVADNVTRYDDIMDYYVSGDSAPIGRLSFSYGY